jgi:hypothetical protein
MNIPSLPTDNYYKFFAIAGLTICIVSVALFWTEMNTIYDGVDKLRIDLVQLNSEKKFLNQDLDRIDTSLAHWGKIDSSILNRDVDSEIAAYFKNKSESLIHNKNLRDYYEFLFKYEDKINPKISKARELRSRLDTQNVISRRIEMQDALINQKTILVQERFKRLNLVGLILLTFFINGIVMLIRGFARWYVLVQKPSDEKLRLEIEDLRKRSSAS